MRKAGNRFWLARSRALMFAKTIFCVTLAGVPSPKALDRCHGAPSKTRRTFEPVDCDRNFIWSYHRLSKRGDRSPRIGTPLQYERPHDWRNRYDSDC